MFDVRVTTSFPGHPLLRQTPQWGGVWGNYRFVVDEPMDRSDYWVVFDNLSAPQQTVCPRRNTLFISAEPPSIRSYPDRFLAQFAKVITCQRGVQHPNVLFRQQALPWHVGTGGYHNWSREGVFLDYDKLAAMGPSDLPKTRLLSVISSAKNQTRGHVARLRFVEQLQAAFGSDVDVYGFGIREIADKWQAIAPYKYHVAIENSSIDDYWTEKLSDTFLGGTFPIYHGASNVASYFDVGSLLRIDIGQPEAAVAAIRAAIAEERFEKSSSLIADSRDRVLNRYNLFPMLVEQFEQARTRSPGGDEPSEVIALRPAARFDPATTRLVRTLAHYVPRGIKARLK